MVIVYIQVIKSGIIPPNIVCINPRGLSDADLLKTKELFEGTDENGTEWILTGFYRGDKGRLFAREFVEL